MPYGYSWDISQGFVANESSSIKKENTIIVCKTEGSAVFKMKTKERVRMGDDTSKALIVVRNNSPGVCKKNSDHLTPMRWQPLEVTTSSSLCAFG